jgi:primosomal protein N''
MLGKMVEKQKVEILKMVERTKGRIAKCRNYY